MAVGVWRGVNNVARKVNRQWRGVDNIAREIKNEWRGVNNVARLCFQKSLVLFDNGQTNYTWVNATNNGSALVPNANATFYIQQSVDISRYSKIGITFIDSSLPKNSTYYNANVRFYNANYSLSSRIFDDGYDRNPSNVITWMFNITGDGYNDGSIANHDLTNFRPGFLFMLWNESWYGGYSFNGSILKIWFE